MTMRFLFCRHSDGLPVAQMATIEQLHKYGRLYLTRRDGFFIASETRNITDGPVPLMERLNGAIILRKLIDTEV
jgi:hypothetical protein